MSSILAALNLDLPAQTRDGRNRRQVLSAIPWSPTSTTMVSYVSANRVLIIADESQARRIKARLPQHMQVYLALLADAACASTLTNGWNVGQLEVKGYLGRFQVLVPPGADAAPTAQPDNLGQLLNIANGLFDQVIDCSADALISAVIKPPGYYHVGSSEKLIDTAVDEVAGLIGEFEKPRYFHYDPAICAHGSSGVKGCTRCLEACPTEAIISIGDKIEVNPYLCQGGGSCASSCPSGAISYTYPKAEEQIELLRLVLQGLRELSSHEGISLLIYDHEHSDDNITGQLAQMPEFIIPFKVEDIGSVGLDLMSCALAYGASQVYIYIPESVTPQVAEVLQSNIDLLMLIIDGLALSTHRLQAINSLSMISAAPTSVVLDEVARFSPVGNKRTRIRAALSYLHACSQAAPASLPLPKGAPFGQIIVDTQACTLCMACVSVCPGKALQDGGEGPALNFIEGNCVQCGVCVNACPEQAIQPDARLHFDHQAVASTRVLNQEQPFRCLSCGKPFATRSMIEAMTEKLKGHWMFTDETAMNRLKMCEDCRVIALFEER